MDSLYHIRLCSDETPQSHRQNTRNTTLFIAPLADVMHCQVLGGQRGGGGGGSSSSHIVQGGYERAWPSPMAPAYPVAAELTSTAAYMAAAAASFYFCLRPVPEATVGCRPPTPTDVRCSAAPNTNFFLHSNFVKPCGEQVNDGK